MRAVPVIEALTASDLPAVRALLVENDLPVDDLEDPEIAFFGVFDRGALRGVVGVQDCAGGGLLRSLAVHRDARSHGVGRLLVEHAYARGGVFLLTTGAADYFARHGFVAVARELVPAGLRATAQFASLCPTTAVVMHRAG